MIDRAFTIDPKRIWGKSVMEYLQIHFDADGKIIGVKWEATSSGPSLYDMASSFCSKWNSDEGLFIFPDQESAEAMLEIIPERFAGLPVIKVIHGNAVEVEKFPPISFSQLALPNNRSALIFMLALPYLSEISDTLLQSEQCMQINEASTQTEGMLVIGICRYIKELATLLIALGANRDNGNLSAFYGLGASSNIQVNVSGWAVDMVCDLCNPLHYLLKERNFKLGHTNIPIPWDGHIHKTRKNWPDLKKQMQEIGIGWECGDPESEKTINYFIDSSKVPGWDSPTLNGNLLLDYQKDVAKLCAQKGMRALIIFEAGLNKRIQAIVTAEGTNNKRILVICLNRSKYIWQEEIKEWAKPGHIHQVSILQSKCDNPAGRWHIVSHEQLSLPNTNLIDQILAIGFALVIVDDADLVANSMTNRSQSIQRIVSGASKVLLLTDAQKIDERKAATLLDFLDPNASNELNKDKGYDGQDVLDYLEYLTIRRTNTELM